jgi:hypothetical protein
MKSIKIIGLFIAGAIGFFSACDYVDNPFPKKRVRTFVDTFGLDSAANLQTEPEALKNVLLEDYTGHQCGNCPRAHEDAAALAATYGKRLVIMGVHAGLFFTRVDSKYTVNYRTEAGDTYEREWGVEALGLPQGMVDRTPLSGTSPVITRGSWPTQIAAQIAKPVGATLKVTKLYDAASRKLNLKIASKRVGELPADVGLIVWLTEDSVKSLQKDYSIPPPGDNIKDYVHRHVLRDAVNDTWGEDLGTIAQGATKNKYYGYTIPENWNAKHIAAVVALYNKADRTILQVEEVKIAK